MQEHTATQAGSPYNPQNRVNETNTAAPMDHTPEHSLAERLLHAAVHDLGLDERFVDFSEYFIPTRRDDELVVYDKRRLVRYNLETGELELTNKYYEMVEVVDHNQHAATTLEQMILG